MAWALSCPCPAFAQQPSSAVAADFKVMTAFYEAGEKPVAAAELFAHEGRIYRIAFESQEIAVVDPSAERIYLLDLSPKRKAQTEISFLELDNELAKLRTTLKSAVVRLEKKGSRADRIAAEMTRSLIEPKLSSKFDRDKLTLSMKNEHVQIEAAGEHEPDALRLALLARTLPALLKLESIRDPNGMPPFARLDAIFTLMSEHKLRPNEVSVLYRLAGKPYRNRWTYQLAPSLTDREREALHRVDAFHAEAPRLRFDLYERHEKPQ